MIALAVPVFGGLLLCGMTLCRLDAFESTELPALLQTGAHACQLLPEGVGQTTQQRLDLRRADLEFKETTRKQNHMLSA